jgi:hypothetical protein
MSHQTLHLYNRQNLIDLKSYLKLINNNDAVVIFVSNKDQNNMSKIDELFSKYSHQTHIVSNNEDYKNLLSLVRKYKRTFTWK